MTFSSKDFEALLAECLQLYETEGLVAVDALLAARPQHAERVMARFEELSRLGLLGEERDSEPQRLGRYRVVRRLAQGGMGTVFLAVDEELGQRVALKAAAVPIGSSERINERFQREIRAIRELDHPGIVRVLGAGESEGRPYFAMDYVEGATAGEVLDELNRRDIPCEQLTGDVVRRLVRSAADDESDDGAVWPETYIEVVVRIVIDVADALAHAHDHGIVHRDVKPSNVMVRLDGRAQVLDFGLAHLPDQSALTRTGDLAGTPYYASPEQAAGRTVDARSDVYSLGVTLFELLTLRRPFDGRSAAQVLKRIQTREPPRPSRWNPRVPPSLEAICLTALEKEPGQRFASARELAADLRRFLRFEPVRARGIGPLRRAARFARRNPALFAVAALLLFVAIGAPAGLLWANARIRGERDHAQAAADEAREQARLKSRVTDFLVELYAVEGARDPGGSGGPGSAAPMGARDFLDRGRERIESDFDDEPLVRAALFEAIGRAYRNLGLHAEALPLLDRAFALRERELGAHVDVASVLLELAEVHLAVTHADTAFALARRSLDVFDEAGRGDDPGAIAARIVLADAANEREEPRLAKELLRDALELTDGVAGAPATSVADILERLGRLAYEQGEFDEAAAHLERAVGLRAASWSPDPAAIADDHAALAAVYRASGALERASAAEAEASRLRSASGPSAGESDQGALEVAHLLPPWRNAYDASFQSGITALQAARYADATRAFEDCRGVRPRHPVCAYNIACAYALSGDVERGLEWLSTAFDEGFGSFAGRADVAEKDLDISVLREHPDGRALFRVMRARRARAAAYGGQPASRAPREHEGELPLLVVLHASGSTKDDVVEGGWGRLADELGLFVLAPSGTLATGERPRDGMAWFEDIEAFGLRPFAFEEPVLDAVRAFCETHPVDAQRIWIAGERDAALLAFDLAVRSPGLFDGVVMVDGPVWPDVAIERTQAAALIGLRVRAVYSEGGGARSSWPEHLGASELAGRVERWLRRRGLVDGSSVTLLPRAADEIEAVVASLGTPQPGLDR